MKRSAGILLYRLRPDGPEVLLVHPGGPFWAKKDLGAWSIPKGEIGDAEDAFEAAKRELLEETGLSVEGPLSALAPVRQKGGKVVLAWAAEGDCDAAAIRSYTFPLEWPLKSGRMQEFPEVDKAAWLPLPAARAKLLAAQLPLLDELEDLLSRNTGNTGARP